MKAVKKSVILGLVSLTVLSGAGVVGCSPAQSSTPYTNGITVPRWDNKQIDVYGDGDRVQLSRGSKVLSPPVNLSALPPAYGSSNMAQGLYPGGVTADRISDLAHSVQGVDSAHAIVTGRTAIIGLDLRRDLRSSEAGPILQEIRQRLMIQAPIFQQVYITADRGLSRRIWNVTEGIRQGRGLSSFDGEIRFLVNTIPPVPPVDLPRE